MFNFPRYTLAQIWGGGLVPQNVCEVPPIQKSVLSSEHISFLENIIREEALIYPNCAYDGIRSCSIIPYFNTCIYIAILYEVGLGYTCSHTTERYAYDNNYYTVYHNILNTNEWIFA